MRPDQLSILAAQCRYDQLDRPSNAIRVRLNATVFNVEPTKHRGDYSPVDYVLNHVPGTGNDTTATTVTATTGTARTRAGACGPST